MILAHFIAHTHIKLTAHIPHCRYAVLPCRIPSPYVTSRHVRNTYEYSLHVYTSLPNSKAADILYITSTYQTYTMSCQSVIIPDTDTDTDTDTDIQRTDMDATLLILVTMSSMIASFRCHTQCATGDKTQTCIVCLL